MEQLTVKQALEQGYEYYVYNSDGFQSLKHISDMDMDFDKDDIRVVNKESQHPCGMSSKDIAETLAEIIHCNYVEETGSDHDDVYDLIKDIDFSESEKIINEALSKINYYKASNIKLIP